MTMFTEILSAPSSDFVIHMAGDYDAALLFIQQRAAAAGMCVSVSKQDFIYTGGRESGFQVRFINYPRFPAEMNELAQQAINLGEALMAHLGQHSFTIVGPDQTQFFSRRPK